MTETKKVGKYPCPFCDHEPFRNPQALNAHIQWKHKNEGSETAVQNADVQDTEAAPKTEKEPKRLSEVLEETIGQEEKPSGQNENVQGLLDSALKAGFDISMVDPFLRETAFAKEVKREIGEIQDSIKYLTTAIDGIAKIVKNFVANLEQGAGATVKTSNPGNPGAASANPSKQHIETGKTPPAGGLNELAGGQQGGQSVPGGRYLPLIQTFLRAMELTRETPAPANPQNNFVKQFLDATQLVSTMRKATIDEMQVMFSSMANFFKTMPKILSSAESGETKESPKPPVKHLEE